MDTWFYNLLSRLEENPRDQLAWQQLKKRLRRDPEDTCCQLFFGYLVNSQSESPIENLLSEHCLEVFNEIVAFYREFIERTNAYGDIWGGGKEFWFMVQFLEIWTKRIQPKLPPNKAQVLNQVLKQARDMTEQHKVVGTSTGPTLPFLPQEVAWHLPLYLKPASILADYPEFRHMYFLPGELQPLCADLEKYKLSPFSERYLESLLHETRRSAVKNNLLYFAETFPLVLQAKWAYAVYISLTRGDWCAHPFIRRLLANSYWEAKAAGEIAFPDEKQQELTLKIKDS